MASDCVPHRKALLEQVHALTTEAAAARAELAAHQEQFTAVGQRKMAQAAQAEAALQTRLAASETARAAERQAAAAAVREADVGVTTLLGALHDAESAAADGAAMLHSRLRRVSAALAECQRREESHLGELVSLRTQLHAAMDAQELAVATVEASVAPLHALVDGLQTRLVCDQSEAASKLQLLTDAFSALRAEYEATLAALSAEEAQRAALERQCEAIEALLAAEARRQQELARNLEAELASREAELARALEASHEKAGQLSRATAEAAEQAESAAEAIGALRAEVSEVEGQRQGIERKLRRTEAELAALGTERARLEAELASIQTIAASELAEAEAERVDEVGRLLHAAAEREHLLDSQRAVLLEEKLRAESHAGASKVRLAAEVEALARQRRELWQRLKRQAVVQAASVRQLQCSLSASRAEQAALRAQAEAEQLTALAKLELCEAELALLRESHRSNEAYHTRRLAASGVVAIKHGRKGKPHPRHIRCVGERLEWAKAEIATRSAETLRTLSQSISAGGELGDLGDLVMAADGARQYDKGLVASEIQTIRAGLSAESLKRYAPRAKYDEGLCLSVLASSRCLDLEFRSRAARDEWWAMLRRWHELLTSPSRPAGWLSPLPAPPSHALASTTAMGMSTVPIGRAVTALSRAVSQPSLPSRVPPAGALPAPPAPPAPAAAPAPMASETHLPERTVPITPPRSGSFPPIDAHAPSANCSSIDIAAPSPLPSEGPA